MEQRKPLGRPRTGHAFTERLMVYGDKQMMEQLRRVRDLRGKRSLAATVRLLIEEEVARLDRREGKEPTE